ncbi:50S ribosomal protein L29, partial [Gracilibacillus oryzae]
EEGLELFRGQPDYKKSRVIEAFTQHRYPWKENDPFEDQYQRWVAAHPDFPQNVNALLSAREQALIDEEKKEAEELRKDLVNLGVVIRDKGKRQYVRMVRG